MIILLCFPKKRCRSENERIKLGRTTVRFHPPRCVIHLVLHVTCSVPTSAHISTHHNHHVFPSRLTCKIGLERRKRRKDAFLLIFMSAFRSS
ncbi:hypothetical protein BCR43DRAFT_497723 [Syncephalastrum racemosum]|uniref:Uncharacterized protein n=1 Tax=Syncephalastrum racemosum TaxID=13706 RepID=A0A1X2H2M2_SYNRA|nr:hypothetical protein BCR43DRAFT_497723 [Syncephalastrum racemosum]